MATLKSKNLSSAILKRFLKNEYSAFLQQYNEATFKQRGLNEPSANDKAIARFVAKEKSLRATADKFGISHAKVLSALARTSAWAE